MGHILGEVYFPTVRALRCGSGEEAGIRRLAARGVAVDNITAQTVQVKLSTVRDIEIRFAPYDAAIFLVSN